MGGLALRATIGQTMDQVLDKACHASGRKAFPHPAVSSCGRNGARFGGVPLIMRSCRHENLQRAEETKVGSHVVRDGWTEGVEGAAHPAFRPVIRRASVLG
ncbi:hypothetical protein [Mesorhizobium sp. CA4]|uniref:hypothetical protein n=1 Tax=Mesorhizobium sp. CA4 TaxID=588499 RepID=UPI001CD170DE|nr:hypothetical protein [Mesorhizobium sp. CA4]MBZ9822919.1 hypothetical protein [Mesorhizobium sp. CA4]